MKINKDRYSGYGFFLGLAFYLKTDLFIIEQFWLIVAIAFGTWFVLRGSAPNTPLNSDACHCAKKAECDFFNPITETCEYNNV